jgi:hypothetical protein
MKTLKKRLVLVISLALVLAACMIVPDASAMYPAVRERAVPNTANDVANQFVADANRGDYAAVCRLYSTRYLKISRAACFSLYQSAASIYGPFDYRIVRRRRLESAHWRFDLIRWRHPSFIELAHERKGWRIVAGGW